MGESARHAANVNLRSFANASTRSLAFMAALMMCFAIFHAAEHGSDHDNGAPEECISLHMVAEAPVAPADDVPPSSVPNAIFVDQVFDRLAFAVLAHSYNAVFPRGPPIQFFTN